MNLGFLNLIETIEQELKAEFQPGAFRFMDEKLDGAHSKAIQRLGKAIDDFQTHKNFDFLKSEAEIYKQAMLDGLKKFKKLKSYDESMSFLDVLEK